MEMNIRSTNNHNALEDQDCAVCLQKYHYPTQLPCGHVFCFLCVKGISIQSKKCAMCRKQIPTDYLDNPVLLENLPPDQITECSNDQYHWYYEGRNGWWKYDDRSNIELELAFNNGEVECMLLLAGTIYCVDFQNMVQLRRSDPSRRRRVRRDLPNLPFKGVAGIKKIEQIQDQDHEAVEQMQDQGPEAVEQNLTSTSDQGNEVIEQSENELVRNNDENSGLEVSHNVDDVIHSLSNITITNSIEQSSPSNEIN